MNYLNFACGLLAIGSAGIARAEVMPTEEKTVNRVFPEEPGFKSDTQYKRAFEDINKQVEVLKRQAEGAQQTLRATGATAAPISKATPVKARGAASPKKRVAVMRPKSAPQETSRSVTSSRIITESVAHPVSAAQVFAVSAEAEAEADGSLTVLPAGSFVRATVVSGVEANTLEPYPVLLHLQQAFTGLLAIF